MDSANGVGGLYMPGYNATTTGRLMRMRQRRKSTPSTSAGETVDGERSQASAFEGRLRRCPMVLAQPMETVEVEVQCTSESPRGQAVTESRNHSSASQISEKSWRPTRSPVEAEPTLHVQIAAPGQLNHPHHRRSWFLRPPNGANVPPRPAGYERYVQDCVQRHRQAPWRRRRDSDREDIGRSSVDHPAATVGAAADEGDRQSEMRDTAVNGGDVDDSSRLLNARSEPTLVRTGLPDDCYESDSPPWSSLSLSLGNSADTCTLGEASSPGSRQSAPGRQPSRSRNPLLPSSNCEVRPPRFGPGDSIEDIRRAVFASASKPSRSGAGRTGRRSLGRKGRLARYNWAW